MTIPLGVSMSFVLLRPIHDDSGDNILPPRLIWSLIQMATTKISR
jgi:hypothetical protein